MPPLLEDLEAVVRIIWAIHCCRDSLLPCTASIPDGTASPVSATGMRLPTPPLWSASRAADQAANLIGIGVFMFAMSVPGLWATHRRGILLTLTVKS